MKGASYYSRLFYFSSSHVHQTSLGKPRRTRGEGKVGEEEDYEGDQEEICGITTLVTMQGGWNNDGEWVGCGWGGQPLGLRVEAAAS